MKMLYFLVLGFSFLSLQSGSYEGINAKVCNFLTCADPDAEFKNLFDALLLHPEYICKELPEIARKAIRDGYNKNAAYLIQLCAYDQEIINKLALYRNLKKLSMLRNLTISEMAKKAVLDADDRELYVGTYNQIRRVVAQNHLPQARKSSPSKATEYHLKLSAAACEIGSAHSSAFRRMGTRP
jgi:hypothetical protein